MPTDSTPPAGPADAADIRYTYQGPEALRAPVDAALRTVVDPEVALNIVDVGLVHAVAISDTELHLQVTMTSAACPVSDLIIEELESALDAVLPDALAIRVELVWEPPWTPERLSPGARAAMGWTPAGAGHGG